MKVQVVIHTQQKENYGAHDWNGEGECPQYWKFKGGNTFIMEAGDFVAANDLFDKFERDVEFADDYYEEYVVQHKLVRDEDFVESDFVEHWEAAIFVVEVDGTFLCERKVLNYQGEVCAIRHWTMGPEGTQLDHTYEEFEEPVAEEWRVKAEMEMYGEEAAQEVIHS